MPKQQKKPRVKKWVFYVGAFLLLLLGVFALFVNRYLEPALRSRLHTLIVQGSDSLYTYTLGNLNANFFGGNVAVHNLQIRIDSNRYRQLAAVHALPSLTMELDLGSGQINGIDAFALLLSKKITIHEIISKDADIRLLRHVKEEDAPTQTQPLWKMMQPAISSIAIDRISLDGVKLLYRNADTLDALKLQFDKCIGLFDDIRIDSAASADTARIGFTKSINLQFNELKFRTPDSSYKMKADVVAYSSRARTFEVANFKIQPTRKEREDFYKGATRQQTMYTVDYERMKLTNIRLDRFIDNNIISADTLFLDKPVATLYSDRTLPASFESKIGTYPHQRLLKAASTIMVNSVIVSGAALHYTEKSAKTGQEGTLTFDNLNLNIANVTNDSTRIKNVNACVLNATGTVLGSPLQAQFRFFLNDTSGKFAATGTLKNMNADQLNTVAEPLANVKLRSFNISELQYAMQGDDFGATTDVAMQYSNLFVLLQKQNEETGEVKTKKFVTKLLNKFTLYESNPGPDGVLRKATGVQRARISSQPFFGLVWKTLFSGMQAVMMKSGRYE